MGVRRTESVGRHRQGFPKRGSVRILSDAVALDDPTIRHRGASEGYLALKALAAYCGLSVRTLRSYLVHSSRPLPHYRVGGKLLVKRSEFDSWITGFRASEPVRLDAVVADVLRGL
jgi:excisionase family DNA binding protein